MKNKTVAGLLAIFFGSIGIHKFYLKDTGAGVFYLILFMVTTNIFNYPISMFLGFIDAFRLFTMSEEQFNRKYNKNYQVRESRRKNYTPPRATRRTRAQPAPAATRRAKANPFKKTAIAKYKDFEIEEAIVDFNKGLEVDPNDIAIHFNLACAYSLTEQKDKSFSHLDKAVSLGFKDVERIKTHDDLAFLRIQEGFDTFQNNGYRLGQQKTQNTNTPDDALLAQLNKLAELRKKGFLSEQEFAVRKEQLLRR